jgi:hypothetical protein
LKCSSRSRTKTGDVLLPFAASVAGRGLIAAGAGHAQRPREDQTGQPLKGILLGAAVGFVAAAGAQAADMPAKAKPVQYVKICSLYGDGFYYIPGTDTCLKLGGFMRIQTEYNMGAGGVATGNGATMAPLGRFDRSDTNDVNYRVRAVLSWDVRQQTEYGMLRTYIRFGAEVTTPAQSGAGFFVTGISAFPRTSRACLSLASRLMAGHGWRDQCLVLQTMQRGASMPALYHFSDNPFAVIVLAIANNSSEVGTRECSCFSDPPLQWPIS